MDTWRCAAEAGIRLCGVAAIAPCLARLAAHYCTKSEVFDSVQRALHADVLLQKLDHQPGRTRCQSAPIHSPQRFPASFRFWLRRSRSTSAAPCGPIARASSSPASRPRKVRVGVLTTIAPKAGNVGFL